MQYRNSEMKKLGVVKVCLIILGTGFLLGIIFSFILKNIYLYDINSINTKYFSEIKNTNIDSMILLKYVLWNNFSFFVLYWIFCCTSVGIPYIGLSLIYTGIKSGFFITATLMGYGIKGIMLIIGYTFPQYLIYIPVAFLCLRSGYKLCFSLYHEGKLSSKSKMQRIIKNLMVIVILGLALVVGSFLETYIGTFLLKKILLLF